MQGDKRPKALGKGSDRAAFFDGLAFTHKKEHVEAILQAKKPETRERRIVRMTEMLSEHMQAKSAKKGSK